MSDLSAEAKYLLNNPAFQAALAEARRQALAAAMGCDAKDDESRRRYLDAIRTVDKVAAHIGALMATETPEEVDPANYYEEQAKARWGSWLKRSPLP